MVIAGRYALKNLVLYQVGMQGDNSENEAKYMEWPYCGKKKKECRY